jgi:hypothetical protein
MRSLKFLCLSSLMLSCLLISGCDLTIGPKTKEIYTIVHPGAPLQILESQKVTGRVLDGNGNAVRQDVGGWIVMPAEHFAALQRAAGIAPTLKQSEVK